jgi:nicotinate phosphoribosyltransferase
VAAGRGATTGGLTPPRSPRINGAIETGNTIVTTLGRLYRPSLALLTDLYQLTMGDGYWKQGLAEREAVFHMTFRRPPFGGEFAVACGLSYLIDFLGDLRYTAEDGEALARLTSADGHPLFASAFLDELRRWDFRCDVDAIPEGTVIFAQEPLVRVRGPLLQCQLVETTLLNLLNFSTLVATKAARVCRAAGGQPVLEFGLRRAQGIDGGLAASRAAFIGGCAATSNVLAGVLFDIPVKGTHAHSWVMAFPDEQQAFQAYAAAQPHNCVLLVDTYQTRTGVRHAIEVAGQLRQRGQRLLGIRLDSGDLVTLSRQARTLLDEAGLPDVAIVASGDLDEHEIARLRREGATIDVWGVGTRLVTAYDQPALGGVYKLALLRNDRGQWSYKVKLSEDGTKMSDPGLLQVRRLWADDGRALADVIYDELIGIEAPVQFVPLADDLHQRQLDAASHTDLLVPVFRAGQLVYTAPPPSAARAHAAVGLQAFDETVLRLDQPRSYLVGIERRLYDLRCQLISQAQRGEITSPT